MLEYFKENVTWIKDLFTLVFIGTGTIVAILTYRRARATILQPIRTEVIKRQSEILAGLLQILKDNNDSIEAGLDYVNLVQINVLLTLKEYGFIFKHETIVSDKIEKNLYGWLPCGITNTLNDVQVIGTFDKKDTPEFDAQYTQNKFVALKQQVIDIDKIYLTKTHSEFIQKITEYRDDPFMPTGIQVILFELLRDVRLNLTNVLKKDLEKFILQFSKEYFEKKEAPQFNPLGVYNSFNHSKIHHRDTLAKLKSEIRKYLRIDEGW